MAIQTIKATIQMRIGNEEDFDPDQMTAGEWSVSKDVKYVRMCFMPGLCLRMATYEAFEQDMKEIQLILATCQDIQVAVEGFMQLASQHESQAEAWSLTSKSWAIGGTGARIGEDTDNSKYYSEQSKAEANRAKDEADRAAAIAGIDIDSALSETSANPVQNKVITKALKEIDVDIADKSVDFEEAKTRKNIESGEKIPVLFGKIKKWFADLKPVAFSGKYTDLSDRLTLTNNLLATIPGTALDATMGKALKDELDSQNINFANSLDQINDNLSIKINSYSFQSINVTKGKLTTIEQQIDIPNGYKPVGIVGWSTSHPGWGSIRSIRLINNSRNTVRIYFYTDYADYPENFLVDIMMLPAKWFT